MKNIDKEPTYYVSLTEYNEVKRMFLKANNEINTLKDLLKECVELMDNTNVMNTNIDVYMQRKKDVLNAISQALGEDK